MPFARQFTHGVCRLFSNWALTRCWIVLFGGDRLQGQTRRIFVTLLIAIGSLLSVPAGAAVEPERTKLAIGVSIPPQAYFLAAIGGEHLQVSVLLDSGQDPHTYTPNSAQMVELGKVQAFFPAGLDIETRWLVKIQSMFPAIEWVADEQIQPDSHFWLAPRAVIDHVNLMRDTLLTLDPDNAATYQQNTTQFVETLQQLDEQFATLFQDAGKQNRFMVQHAAWDTFADDYALEQLVIEEEGKAASIKHMAGLINTARVLQIDTVFADVAHSNKVAFTVARQAGARVLRLNTISADWLEDLNSAVTSIEAVLR